MKIIASLIVILNHSFGSSDNENETRSRFRYNIEKVSSTISVDGNHTEQGWENIKAIPNFINHWPLDSGNAEAITQVKVTYDEEFIYVLADCHDDGTRVIQSLKRDDDNAHWGSDNYTFVLDPMKFAS